MRTYGVPPQVGGAHAATLLTINKRLLCESKHMLLVAAATIAVGATARWRTQLRGHSPLGSNRRAYYPSVAFTSGTLPFGCCDLLSGAGSDIIDFPQIAKKKKQGPDGSIFSKSVKLKRMDFFQGLPVSQYLVTDRSGYPVQADCVKVEFLLFVRTYQPSKRSY